MIDQFEELFTLGSPPAVVQEFCRRVAEHSLHRAPVVIAVRSDHVGGLSVDPTPQPSRRAGPPPGRPAGRRRLREAIEQPAARAGLRLEPGLADVLVRDCEGEPGALPLLSHALVETWRRRDGPVLTVEGYRRAAASVWPSLRCSPTACTTACRPDQRTTLRSVLLRLVTPALDGEPVR